MGFLAQWHGRDPGSLRALFALRALFGFVAGGGAAFALVSAAGQVPRVGALGGVLAMMGTMMVRGTSAREKGAEIARLALAAALSAALAAGLSPWPLLGYAGFVGVMAAAAWVQQWGPAGVAVSMAAFMSHFFTLFLKAGPSEIPALALAVAAGYVGLAVVLLVLVPDRIRGRARRLVPGFRVRARRVVDVARRVAEKGSPRQARRALLAATADVQETALRIDEALDLPAARAGVADAARLRDHVFVAELLADHIAAAMIIGLREDGGAARPDLIRQLDPARASVRPIQAPPATTAELMPPRSDVSEDRVAALVSRLGVALSSVESAAALPDAAVSETPDVWSTSEENAGPDPADPSSAAGPRPAIRKVVQVALAGALSLVVGRWLSDAYWSYAVLGAFVTLLTTPTRGASVRRAVDRVLGTAFGVAGGMGLAALLSGRSGVEIAAMLALVFVAFWSFQASYLVMVLLFTVMTGLLYDLMGADLSALLLVRLWETAIGAGIGAAVAYLVLPSSTRGALDEALVAALDALDALLEALDPRIAYPSEWETVYSRIRRFDRATAVFREAGKPLASRLPGQTARDARYDVVLAASLRFRVRALAAATTGSDGLVRPVPLDATPALDAVRRGARRAREQALAPVARVALQPMESSDVRALAAVHGPLGDALSALYERLDSFAESRALAAEEDPAPRRASPMLPRS
ncbi:MAG TPA: FUSC family protein [Rubricoccaceae bacterium]|jgi:hypothetical protein